MDTKPQILRFSNSLGSTKTPTNLWASHKHSFGEWPNVQFQGNCTTLANQKGKITKTIATILKLFQIICKFALKNYFKNIEK